MGVYLCVLVSRLAGSPRAVPVTTAHLPVQLSASTSQTGNSGWVEGEVSHAKVKNVLLPATNIERGKHLCFSHMCRDGGHAEITEYSISSPDHTLSSHRVSC